MKLIEIKNPMQHPTKITFNLYRGISGSTADIARKGEPIPLPNRGIHFWLTASSDTTINTLLARYDMEIGNSYASPDGVWINKKITASVHNGRVFLPEGYGICNDTMHCKEFGRSWNYEDPSDEWPIGPHYKVGSVPGYIGSKKSIINYEIVADEKQQ